MGCSRWVEVEALCAKGIDERFDINWYNSSSFVAILISVALQLHAEGITE